MSFRSLLVSTEYIALLRDKEQCAKRRFSTFDSTTPSIIDPLIQITTFSCFDDATN
ncbi:unnamed protein product [Fusarium venenatum]|uniref:Uncharacterized protein n=1 Tax=Fusarium venenatum TaxID=56646 RepID=A0A2L2SN74_9HYPO|nr:uncharacterized protein FVRRES_11575 [Fusarium venenatum]CEI38884.1 unnamed protein product [Fusarium venenatum]